jgi:hypothetical protein
MADWDADSAQLEQNLRSVLETIQDDSRRRTVVSVETARLWHTGTLRGLAVPTQADTWNELRHNIREAVQAYFFDGTPPRLIRLHLVRDELLCTG